MKRSTMLIISLLVSVCLAGIACADDIQTANKLTDKKKVTYPSAKSVKSDVKKVGTSTEGQKKEDGGTITTKQSKQQHDRARQTIDNLK